MMTCPRCGGKVDPDGTGEAFVCRQCGDEWPLETSTSPLAMFQAVMESERDDLAAMDLTEYGRRRYDQTVGLIDRLLDIRECRT